MRKNNSTKSFYELTEHNRLQVLVFFLLLLTSIFCVFMACLPLLQGFFEDFLNGTVYNKTGDFVSYSMETKEPMKGISYISSWAVDIYKNTSSESRYWFNPLLSMILITFMAGFGITVVLTSLLPRNIGYMRQKVERVIVNTIDKIVFITNHSHSDDEYERVIELILNADLQSLQNLSEEWNMTLEDLKILHKAVKWRENSFLYRATHFNDGIRAYMRFYFTVQYSNAVIGLVYIGAAVLIIIIGLRGLKFIPPTQPSLVLFALSLEFSLLITYAVTLMYGKQDDEQLADSNKHTSNSTESILLGKDFGSSKEIENLLRVFINKKK